MELRKRVVFDGMLITYRLSNVLRNEHLSTWEQVAAYGYYDRIPNCGIKTKAEILDNLYELKLLKPPEKIIPSTDPATAVRVLDHLIEAAQKVQRRLRAGHIAQKDITVLKMHLSVVANTFRKR